MAFFAGHRGMGTGQWEFTTIVIKAHMIPTGGIMTDRTILAILPIVGIILLMAGKTILRRTFELLIHMARFTTDFYMLAFKFECSQIVIKFCRRPAIRCMAAGAVYSKSAFMRLILLMT
jgi:hypothetical protein